MHLQNGAVVVGFGTEQIRRGLVHLGIVGIFLKKQVDMFLGFFGFMACNQQVRNVNVGLRIVRLKFESAVEFFISVEPVLQFDVRLSQLIVCVCVA